jgi:hypothetical protein
LENLSLTGFDQGMTHVSSLVLFYEKTTCHN